MANIIVYSCQPGKREEKKELIALFDNGFEECYGTKAGVVVHETNSGTGINAACGNEITVFVYAPIEHSGSKKALLISKLDAAVKRVYGAHMHCIVVIEEYIAQNHAISGVLPSTEAV